MFLWLITDYYSYIGANTTERHLSSIVDLCSARLLSIIAVDSGGKSLWCNRIWQGTVLEWMIHKVVVDVQCKIMPHCKIIKCYSSLSSIQHISFSTFISFKDVRSLNIERIA